MQPPNPPLIVMAALCCLAGVVHFQLRRRFLRQKQLIAGLNNELNIALRCLSEAGNMEHQANFTASLEGAQIQARLAQAGATSRGNGAGPPPPLPEKYRHVTMLADRGINSDEIAAILKISPHETEQMIKLFQFANPANLAKSQN